MRNDRLKVIFFTSFHSDYLRKDIFIASTTKGVCRISMGDESTFIQDIKERYPGYRYIKNDKYFSHILQELNRYFQGKSVNFSASLDLSGTPFQKKIWKRIKEIPYGRTASYKEVAISAGKASSSRAAGGACGKNPVPIIIPCHRVIYSSGKPGGYSGGIEIKEKLLRLEGIL